MCEDNIAGVNTISTRDVTVDTSLKTQTCKCNRIIKWSNEMRYGMCLKCMYVCVSGYIEEHKSDVITIQMRIYCRNSMLISSQSLSAVNDQ